VRLKSSRATTIALENSSGVIAPGLNHTEKQLGALPFVAESLWGVTNAFNGILFFSDMRALDPASAFVVLKAVSSDTLLLRVCGIRGTHVVINARNEVLHLFLRAMSFLQLILRAIVRYYTIFDHVARRVRIGRQVFCA
jgi:hypothetical protein